MKILKVTIFLITNLFTLFSFHLNILHTSDLRSHFEMFSSKNQTCDPETHDQTEQASKCYGGAARRAGFIRKYRTEKDNVLILDAGGQYLGTTWYHAFRGKMSRYFLDYMEYDAITLGTYDFDLGLAGLEPLLNGSKYKIVLSNFRKTSKSTEMINNTLNYHIVLTRDGTKIGIIGYVTPMTRLMSSIDGLAIDHEFQIKAHVIALKDQRVNTIIALGHSGMLIDKMIAERFPEIDIIIGGSTGSMLYTGENKEGDNVAGEYPFVYHHNMSRKTLVVNVGKLGKYIGVLQVEIDNFGRITRWEGNPVTMDSSVPVDQTVVDYLKSKETELKTYVASVVGSIQVNFSIETDIKICRIKECYTGNMYTDAVVNYVHRTFKWSNLTLAFINSGIFKASLMKRDITYSRLRYVLPYFQNKIFIITTNGSNLLKAFENSVLYFSLTTRHGKFLQVSGFKVKYDMTKENGKRVESLKTKRCHECLEYDDIVKEKMYELVTSTYIGKGGEGYLMFKGSEHRLIDVGDVHVALTYLRDFSPIVPKIEERITGMETFPDDTRGKKRNIGTRSECTYFFMLLFCRLVLEI